jgi:hypothetical protein
MGTSGVGNERRSKPLEVDSEPSACGPAKLAANESCALDFEPLVLVEAREASPRIVPLIGRRATPIGRDHAHASRKGSACSYRSPSSDCAKCTIVARLSVPAAARAVEVPAPRPQYPRGDSRRPRPPREGDAYGQRQVHAGPLCCGVMAAHLRPSRACGRRTSRRCQRGGGSVAGCQRDDANVRRWGTSSLRT